MSRVLLTGATGFVGGALLRRLAEQREHVVVATTRSSPPGIPSSPGVVPVGGLDASAQTDWRDALAGCDTVVHAAARVHVMDKAAGSDLAAFRAVNLAGTRRLAQQAADSSVRRFVYLSSIKVNGEGTAPGRPYRATDRPAPVDAYGVSKLEAEQALQEVSLASGMEFVIVRPPLVYGPGVRANFAALVRLVRRGVPLPFGAIDNRRSLVALDNLVDLLVQCLDAPQARNRVLLVSDGQDMSTPELIRGIAAAAGVPARLFPMPPAALRWLGTLAGRRAAMDRLCGNLQVDSTQTQALLGWQPPVDVAEALRRAVHAG